MVTLCPFQQYFSDIWTMGGCQLKNATEPCLRLERFLPRAGLELGIARSVGERLSHLATGVPGT